MPTFVMEDYPRPVMVGRRANGRLHPVVHLSDDRTQVWSRATNPDSTAVVHTLCGLSDEDTLKFIPVADSAEYDRLCQRCEAAAEGEARIRRLIR